MGFRATGAGSLEHTPDMPWKSGNEICVQKPSVQPGASLAASDGCGVWPGPGAHMKHDHRAGPLAEEHRWPCQGSPGPPLASSGRGPCQSSASPGPLPPGPAITPPHSFPSDRAGTPTPCTCRVRALLCPCRGHLVFLRQPPPPDLTPQIPSLRVACWAEHPGSRWPLKRS